MANNMYNHGADVRRRPVNNMQNNARNSNNSNPGNSGNNGGSSNNASCEELMRAIMEADFFAQDLKLYLDTHPDDTRAVEMFRDAVRQSKACKAAFEDSFWPLVADSAGTEGNWDWFNGVWPPFN